MLRETFERRNLIPTGGVGNRGVMAALDTRCARTTRPHWYVYALAKRCASYKILSHPCPSFLLVLSHTSSFLSLHFFLKYFLSSTQHSQLWYSSPHNINFVSPLKPFHSAT